MNSQYTAANPGNKFLFPWIICIIGMLFYCFNYFLRVSPSVMQEDLLQTFHITAYQFGALAAFYYYAYVPMQLPAGMIYDKFGARIVLSFACLTAVIGLAIFVGADSYTFAALGRFLIGLGCAFAYIGVLKLASLWLPTNRFATVAGLTTALAMSCAALSQKYLASAVEYFGYQQALHFAIYCGIGLSVIIFLLVRSRPQRPLHADLIPAPVNLGQLLGAVKIIATNPQMWLIGMIGCLLYLPASVFLDLWGIPYLKAVYQLTPVDAIKISGITFFGWIIAGPVIGAFSDKIKRRRMPLIVTGGAAALLLCIVFYVPGITFSMLKIMFFFIGFCCGAHPLCFALGKENNPIQISGTAVAVTNMLIMAGGAVFQPVVGKLLDLHTTSPLGPDGLPIYTSSDYTFALSVIPIGVAIGLLLSFFLKETHCQYVTQESHEKIFSPKGEKELFERV
jgi:MFS family permease